MTLRDSPAPPVPSRRPGVYTPLWTNIVSVTWGAIVLAVVALGNTSAKIGKPTWWVGQALPAEPAFTWLIPFALPAAALLAAQFHRRWALHASAMAGASLLAVGWVDRTETPGVALGVTAMGLAGLLLTVASSAGRFRAE